ncbi:MAG: MFS transporter [Candidatus Bathyarchaeota archaeon]|nr:MAG: MFS transporter [Candidatus Bathyarchaeota archaeon]
MLAFTIIWAGQLVSLTGTRMTGFALTIWAWLLTGEATALALVGFFTFAPTVFLSPFAGALVDRWSRKLVMMLSDLAAVTSTTAVFILFLTGNLQIWHLYVTGAFTGAFGAFQFPAYSATVTTMVSKKQYGRASGMLSMANFGANILAPVLAAVLLTYIGIAGILAIDISTFIIALATLLLVHIPQPLVTEEGRKSKGSFWKESVYGFRYIYKRPSLFGLLVIFFTVNLVVTFATTVMAPMLLARTGDDVNALGIVQSAIGIGGVVGSILLSIWGGPRRRINGVFVGLTIAMTGILAIGLGRNLLVWASAAFFTLLFVPLLNGSSQAIWQAKVAPDVQGRVFAARILISQLAVPVSMLLSGSLADNVFEPAMMPEGIWAPIFGMLVGDGPGAGMSLMFVIAGILGILVGLGGFTSRVVREVEDILPDHQSKDNPPNTASS